MALDFSDATTRNSLPTGTVTFLFTDIEGSTERWERDRDAMQDALHHHDAIMRNALESHSGVVFKTVGDAFFAAFRRPDDAVGAALDAQRALALEDFSRIDGLRVRMAVHTGSAEERDGDYYGPTLNRVSRLLSVGHGGQVLLSSTTAQFERKATGGAFELRDLGEHHLKDLTQPERVYQLVAQGIPSDFPPLHSLASMPQNLPTQLSEFIGRDDELRELSNLLAVHRIVTIVGAGGVGKTRTALQVAAHEVGSFADGVWFVELAPLHDGAMIATTIARSLNLRLGSDEDSLRALVQGIGQLEMLLLLDNCEQVIEEASHTAGTIVQHCPNVSILATSRQPLDLDGELTFRLPSLPLDCAMDLFELRAKAVDRKFKVNAKTRPIVRDLCERLDGIALAIELAAARVSVLTPDQLLRRLDERFALLTSGRRDALPRQQTMRAVIDWSYDLLTDEERTFFRRASIFAGGWTLDAAETVCDQNALDTLASLVEKSLVIAERTYDETRYHLSESTRIYAFEKLHDSGEVETYAQRHAQWTCEFAERANARSPVVPLHEWRPPVQRETENIRAALSWALDEEHDPILGARIVAALDILWASLPARESSHWTDAALATLDEAAYPDVAAQLYLIRATGAQAGKARAATAKRALALFEGRAENPIRARAFAVLGDSYNQMGRYEEALAENTRACESFRTAGMRSGWPYARLLNERGIILSNLQRYDEAAAMFQEAIALDERQDDWLRAAITRADFAEAECARGNVDRAVELAESVIAVHSDSNFHRIQGHVRVNLAGYYLLQGNDEKAEETARLALPLVKRFGIAQNVPIAIQHLATVAARRGEAVRAATLGGYVDAWYADHDCKRESTEAKTFALLDAALNARLGPSERERYAGEGATLTDDAAIDMALADVTASASPSTQ